MHRFALALLLTLAACGPDKAPVAPQGCNVSSGMSPEEVAVCYGTACGAEDRPWGVINRYCPIDGVCSDGCGSETRVAFEGNRSTWIARCPESGCP